MAFKGLICSPWAASPPIALEVVVVGFFRLLLPPLASGSSFCFCSWGKAAQQEGQGACAVCCKWIAIVPSAAERGIRCCTHGWEELGYMQDEDGRLGLHFPYLCPALGLCSEDGQPGLQGNRKKTGNFASMICGRWQGVLTVV